MFHEHKFCLGFNDDSDDSSDHPRKKHNPAPKIAEVKRQAAAKVLDAIYKRRFAQRLSDRPRSSSQTVLGTIETPQEICRVRPDEVSINVLGLPGNLSPMDVFSGVYGVIPPEHAWRVLPQVENPVYFFKSDTPHPLFYHRDQIVRSGPSLNKLSINYCGNLDLSADRTSVIKTTHAYALYKVNLSKAAHLAFEFLPDLAVEIALDILTDSGASGSSLSRVLQPLDTRSKHTYRSAFVSAWRILDPALPPSKILYPYSVSAASRDLPLIEELGMIGRPVSDHIMSKILYASGAYSRIHHHVEKSLIRAPAYTKPVLGLPRLQRAIASLMPPGAVDLEVVGVVDHKYKCSSPKIVWHPPAKKFLMRVPERCTLHAADTCSCWVGPYLFSAMDSWRENSTPKVKVPSKAAICQAFMHCMEGEGDGDKSKPIEATDAGRPYLRIVVHKPETGSDADDEDDEDGAGDQTPGRSRRVSSTSDLTLAPNRLAGTSSPLASPTEPSFPLPPSTSKDGRSFPTESAITPINILWLTAVAVPPRSATCLSGIFSGVIDLCQRGLREAAIVESETPTMQTATIEDEFTVQALRELATRQHEEIRRLRKQLELKDAELNYTQGLLTEKWADGKRAIRSE